LESIGLRRPRLDAADLRRAVWKVGRSAGLIQTRTRDPRIAVVGAVGIPLFGLAWARAFNARWLARRLRPILRGRPDLFLTSLPSAIDLLDGIDARLSVYYRVDDWTQWPGIDGGVASDLERRTMDRVDLTFCTSRALLDGAWSRSGEAIHLPQGVDVEHFAAARRAGPSHPLLEDLPRPLLGFFGTIDDRLDPAILRCLARGWQGSVALVGPRLQGAPRLPRGIHWIDRVDYEDLVPIARAIDVWMLPYRVGRRTDAIDPLKLREYLATGRPVVSTPLPEVAGWAPHVRIAADPDEFLRIAAQAAAAPQQGRAERLACLAGHSWLDRRRTFLRSLAAVSGAM